MDVDVDVMIPTWVVKRTLRVLTELDSVASAPAFTRREEDTAAREAASAVLYVESKVSALVMPVCTEAAFDEASLAAVSMTAMFALAALSAVETAPVLAALALSAFWRAEVLVPRLTSAAAVATSAVDIACRVVEVDEAKLATRVLAVAWLPLRAANGREIYSQEWGLHRITK